MKIAIIAWGSLIHSPCGHSPSDVALELRSEWKNDGPILPVEFSRVSRDGRLTLVIDAVNGTACPTYHAAARAEELDAAVENLRLRERMPTGQKIGRIIKGTSSTSGPCEIVRTWLEATDYDAVIWTDLPPNFSARTGRSFSVANAVDYLINLAEPARTLAFRYIIEAPNTTATAVRKESNWPEVTAVHEAGHVVVACALGLRLERLSRIPFADPVGAPPTRGLRVSGQRSLAADVALNLGGPWAQVVHFPTSLPERKLPLFVTRIVVPTAVMPRAAWDIYDQTGWDASDLKLYVQLLYMASMPYQGGRMSFGQMLLAVDEHLGRWIRRPDQASAIHFVQSRLMTEPVIIGPTLSQLETDVLNLLPQNERDTVLPAGLSKI